MLQPASDAAREQVISTMIELTRVSNLHRVIAAGDDSTEINLLLRRRGFLRVATVGTCVARGQHVVGLVGGRHSLQALQVTLAQIAQFLSPTAAIAVAIDSRELGFGLKIRDRLECLGFRIEAGVRCHERFILSAHRQDFNAMAKAG